MDRIKIIKIAFNPKEGFGFILYILSILFDKRFCLRGSVANMQARSYAENY